MCSDIKYPVASFTFSYNRAARRVKGAQVMEAVKRVADNYDDTHRYYQYRRYRNGDIYRIGCRSDNEHLNLIVLVNGTEWIDPQGDYAEISVQSIDQTSERRLCENSNHDKTIDFVRDFGELLKKELPKQAVAVR